MKILLVIALVLGASVAGAGAAVTLFGHAPQAHLAATDLHPIDATNDSGSEDVEAVVADLKAEMLMLSNQVARLEEELDATRLELARRPVEPDGADELEAAELAAALSDAPGSRDFVAKVIEDLRAEERRKREEERKQRDEDSILRRAERIADELGLNAAQETSLRDYLTLQTDKRNAIMDEAREGGFDRDKMRTAFEEMREWGETELVTRFGEDVADKINDLERQDRWGGRGRGGDSGGGGGGGDSGGGGRRGRGF